MITFGDVNRSYDFEGHQLAIILTIGREVNAEIAPSELFWSEYFGHVIVRLRRSWCHGIGVHTDQIGQLVGTLDPSLPETLKPESFESNV